MRDELVEKCRQWLVRRNVPMIQPGMHCTMPEALAAFVGDAIDALEEKNASLQKELDRRVEAVAKDATRPTTEASFEEWHRRECPYIVIFDYTKPCDDVVRHDLSTAAVGRNEFLRKRFAGRTCREVYEAERGAGEIGSEKERCLTAATMIEAKLFSVPDRKERIRLLAEWCEDVAREAHEEALGELRVAVESHDERHAKFVAAPTAESLAQVIAERAVIVDTALDVIRSDARKAKAAEDPS